MEEMFCSNLFMEMDFMFKNFSIQKKVLLVCENKDISPFDLCNCKLVKIET